MIDVVYKVSHITVSVSDFLGPERGVAIGIVYLGNSQQ